MSVLTKPVGNTSAVPLLMRLILGVTFFAHGAQKVMGWYGGSGLQETISQFEQGLGIPAPLGYLAAFTEFLGGIALILGFATRLFSVGLFIEMIVAAWMVHVPQGFFLNFQAPPGHGAGFEFNLALFGLSLALTLTGPGHYSLDYKLFVARWHHDKPLGDIGFARR